MSKILRMKSLSVWPVIAAALVLTSALWAAPITLGSFTTSIGNGPGSLSSQYGVAQGLWNSTTIYDLTFDLNNLPTAPISLTLGPSDANFAALVGIMDTGNAQFGSTIYTNAGLNAYGNTYFAGEGNIGLALLGFAYPSPNASAYTITGMGVTLSNFTGSAGAGASFGYTANLTVQGYQGPPVNPVPEPPTFLLWLGGLLLLALGARVSPPGNLEAPRA